MDALDKDFEILLDDYERVVALESIGASIRHPTMQTVARRWVAHEYYNSSSETNTGVRGAVDTIVGGAVNGVGKLSNILLDRMNAWLSAKEQNIRNKIKDVTSKATGLQKNIMVLEPKLRLLTTIANKQIETGSWTSKLCVEDKVDIEACISFSEKSTVLDDMAKSYTVFTSVLGRPKTRKGEEMNLRKLGRSTGWAINRSKGILGYVSLNQGLEAWPLPGNVIITLRGSGVGGQTLDFAVARDGSYGEHIESIDLDTANRAIKAAWRLTEILKTRNVKRGVFSYTGIYEKIEELKASTNTEVDKAALRAATKRIKNSLAVEDAITTAMVRVCEGLTKITRLSIS